MHGWALNQIIEWRGRPLAIRVDSGAEYVSSTLMTQAERQGIALTCIQPGKPQQNHLAITRTSGVLARYMLSVTTGRSGTNGWTYNSERPNMGIGGSTPAMKLKMAEKILQPRPVKTGRITIDRVDQRDPDGEAPRPTRRCDDRQEAHHLRPLFQSSMIFKS